MARDRAPHGHLAGQYGCYRQTDDGEHGCVFDGYEGATEWDCNETIAIKTKYECQYWRKHEEHQAPVTCPKCHTTF